MKPLNQEGQQMMAQIAQKYNLSLEASMAMLEAVVNGGGRMAQFYINELGGGGQWMQGGMTMVGDMFNYSLKSTVNNLCQELSNLISSQNIFLNVPVNINGNYSFSGNWWPAELGSPSSSGAQNNIKYAFFPAPARRLAIEINGNISVYDTLDHNINGVSQQQGSGFSVLFTSQYGNVDVLNLPIISGNGTIKKEPAPFSPQENNQSHPNIHPIHPIEVSNVSQPSVKDDGDIFIKIDKLAELFNKGILTESEFTAKKTELLAKL